MPVDFIHEWVAFRNQWSYIIFGVLSDFCEIWVSGQLLEVAKQIILVDIWGYYESFEQVN